MAQRHNVLTRLFLKYFWVDSVKNQELKHLLDVIETNKNQHISTSSREVNNYQSNNSELIKNIRPGEVHIHGQINSVTGRFVRQGLHITEGVLSDSTASVRLVWWNQPFIASGIKRGEIYEVTGHYALHKSRFSITNPKVQLLSEGCFKEKPKQIQVPKVAVKEVPHHTIWDDPIYGPGVNPDSAWGKLRKKVFIRDNYTCQSCGSTLNLTVDHKLEKSLGGLNNMSNLQTLCKVCHEAKHGRKFLERSFSVEDNYGEVVKVNTKVQEIKKALHNQSDIQIKYKSASAIRSYRVIRPLKIRRTGRGVYVQAFCRLDNDFRVFRVGRMDLIQNRFGINKYIDDPSKVKEFPEEVINRFNNLFS